MRVGDWGSAPFDLLLAIQVLPYLDDPKAFLHLSRTLLRPGGRIVISIDHPLRNCFFDAEMEELSPYPLRSYFDQKPLDWKFGMDMPMQAAHHPLGQWLTWVIEAGLHLREMLELPAPLEICEELWPEDSPLFPLREIPHTAIIVAEVPK
jgi:hypothetical protein